MLRKVFKKLFNIPWDKSTALLFGNAGTATVIIPDASALIGISPL